MYRVFCESYKNFIELTEKDSYRYKISNVFELIVDIDKYKQEKEKESEAYKNLCDLIDSMEGSIEKFPKFKAFLWTLEARNIKSKKYEISKEDDLEEQIKLINSFLKLAYWN